MRPMLNDLELPNVQEVATYERRTLAEHKPPGMDGSLLQNLGRRPTRLVLWGVAASPEARDVIEKLDGKFRAGEPMDFTADIVADAALEKIVIDDLKVQELAGKPERFAYVLTLREYIKPVIPEETSSLDLGILDEAKNLVNDLTKGLDIGTEFVTGLEKFVPTFGDLLTRLQQFAQTVRRAGGG